MGSTINPIALRTAKTIIALRTAKTIIALRTAKNLIALRTAKNFLLHSEQPKLFIALRTAKPLIALRTAKLHRVLAVLSAAECNRIKGKQILTLSP